MMPRLVAVTDTNAIAARACHAAAAGETEELFTRLAGSGRSNTFISAHVPGELESHLADTAATNSKLVLAEVEQVLWGQIIPKVPVVDLAVGDYLHPRVRPLLRADPDLPKRLRGDPDDAGTAAVAEFLAPAVILSADSVFTRFGLANTVATTWVPAAYNLLRATGFEASLNDAAQVVELAGRLLFAVAGAAVGGARRYPLPTVAVLAGAALIAWRAGYFESDRRRDTARRLSNAARPWVDGKTSRGARRADGTRGHLLGVAEHGGRLLDHLEVDVKHNETSHFTALLESLDLDGAVVTFDALHTVRANLNWLASHKKGHYIAVVKKNQPLLHARVKALPWRQVPAGSTTRDTGHGRIETRTLKTAHVSRLDFPWARQAIKISRRREDATTGKASRETVYAVTSLTSACATAQDLARLVREHWSIEAHHHIQGRDLR
jgi:predicted transposase YbfD/YdcC